MKKIIFTCIIASISIYNFAQKISILDESNNSVIPFAKVTFIDFDKSILADSLGQFSVAENVSTNSKILIQAFEYEDNVINLKDIINSKIYLSKSHLLLNEVMIKSNSERYDQHALSSIETKKLSDLTRLTPSNIGDVFGNLPGVYSNSFGKGISKPIIRGLQGMRILSFWNGLRIENQQWGNDHGTGLTSLGVEQLEIIKGPSSLQYGSDALGGVIIFQDKKNPNQHSTYVNFNSSFESVTTGFSNQLEYTRSMKNLSFSFATAQSNQADYKLPYGKFLKNSRYSDYQVKSGISYHYKKWLTNLKGHYISQQIGLPGHTHDSLPNKSEFLLESQRRSYTIPAQQIQNIYISNEHKILLEKSKINFLLGYTNNGTTEYEEKFSVPGIKMNLQNIIGNFSYEKQFNKSWKNIAGIQSMFQKSTNEIEAEEQIIPDLKTNDLGIYNVTSYNTGKINFQLGGRIDYRKINSHNSLKFNTLNREFIQYNYSTGFTYKNKIHFTRFSLSSANRTPHVSELLASGVHHGAFRYEIGDRELKSERANQIDFQYDLKKEHFGLSINPYYMMLNNFIFINPSDSLIDNYPLFTYNQEQQVNVSGIDISTHFHPHILHNLHIYNTFSLVNFYSKSKIKLPFIPPARLLSELNYTFQKTRKVYVESINMQYIYMFEQNNVAIYESTTSAYHLIHFSTVIKSNKYKSFEINLSVRNLLNYTYLDHLSRLRVLNIEFPGRNLICSMKWTLQKSNQ